MERRVACFLDEGELEGLNGVSEMLMWESPVRCVAFLLCTIGKGWGEEDHGFGEVVVVLDEPP